MNEEDKKVIGEIINEGVIKLTLQDIEKIEIAQGAFEKLIQQNRWSLMIEKAGLSADKTAEFVETTHKINMCNILMQQLLGLDKLRLKAVKKIAEDKEEKE